MRVRFSKRHVISLLAVNLLLGFVDSFNLLLPKVPSRFRQRVDLEPHTCAAPRSHLNVLTLKYTRTTLQDIVGATNIYMEAELFEGMGISQDH